MHPSWPSLYTCFNTSSIPILPHPALQVCEENVSGLSETEGKENTRLRYHFSSLSEILCWSADPYLHTDPFHKVPSCNISIPKKPKISGLNVVCGQEVIWETAARLPEGHSWTLAGLPYQANRSVDDAVNMGQTRGVCEEPVCGLQLSLQYHHPKSPPVQINPALFTHLHHSMNHQLQHQLLRLWKI